MGAPNHYARTYPVAPDVLFAAVQSSIQDGHYRDQTADAFTRSVHFRTRATMTDYAYNRDGQVSTGADGSQLNLTAVSNRRMLKDGNKPAKRAEALFADVSRRCAAMG